MLWEVTNKITGLNKGFFFLKCIFFKRFFFLKYFFFRSPCVVGMLWEVTDKDTDLLTADMLSVMARAREGTLPLGERDVPGIVARARHKCNR